MRLHAKRQRIRILWHCAFGAVVAVVLVSGSASAGIGTGDAAARAKAQVATSDESRGGATDATFERLARLARAHGNVRVIAGLRVAFRAEGTLGREARASQRAAIVRASGDVGRALHGTRHRVVRTYETIPYIALEVSEAALMRLRSSGVAATLEEDMLRPTSDAQSTPLVEATEAAALGRTGAGWNVAVLDTGVEKTHPFLRQAPGVSKVVSEACFSDGDCPGGTSSSTAVGSGAPCTWASNRCRHGTHVAGIAAGKGATFNGVARGAGLIAIQVFSRFTGSDCASAGEDPCALAFDSDVLAGLQRVFNLRSTFNIAAVSLAVGGGMFSGNCDAAEPSYKAAIDNLRSANIATVIASGNDGFSNTVNSPACISTAVTVGATSKTDVVASFSNSSSIVDLFAPGVQITSSVPVGTGPGGTNFDTFDGTSGAAAHVAGAWAILRQVSPTATALSAENALKATGKPVTDTLASPQITRDRLRVFSAAANLRHTGFKPTQFFGALTGGGVASNGVGLARRTTSTPNPTTSPVTRSLNLSGIPAGAVVHDAYLFWQSVGGPDATIIFKGVARTGTLVGGSGQYNCWNPSNANDGGTGFGGAFRTYRFRVPTAEIPGNGTYTVGGVGNTTGIDGQGASLVVIYRIPSSAQTGRVALRYGAMTAQPGGAAMSHTFTGLNVPTAPTIRELHVGIGDGQTFNDPAMLFAGSVITPANFWSGSDLNYWDDDTIALAASLLPAGTTTRTNSQGATAECLTWSYAALTYRG